MKLIILAELISYDGIHKTLIHNEQGNGNMDICNDMRKENANTNFRTQKTNSAYLQTTSSKGEYAIEHNDNMSKYLPNFTAR